MQGQAGYLSDCRQAAFSTQLAVIRRRRPGRLVPVGDPSRRRVKRVSSRRWPGLAMRFGNSQMSHAGSGRQFLRRRVVPLA